VTIVFISQESKPEDLILEGKRTRKTRADIAKILAEDEAENWDFDEIDENIKPLSQPARFET
jgi:hypothetical protein